MSETPNLPAAVQRPEPTGPGGVPLRDVDTPALTFALGWSLSQPVRAEAYGGFCALVEELLNRVTNRPGSSVPISQYAALLASLPHEVARTVDALYRAHRGQRWASTGSRKGR